MSSEIHLPAEPRTEFGKGAARRLRRADKVPAVVYGHGEDPLHLSLPGHQTMLALKHRNAVLTLDVEGTEHLAFAKFVQRDPIKNFIEHVDFITVRRGEKIQVDVAVLTTGDPVGGTVVTVEHQTVAVLADAMNLPESITVDVEGFEAGHQVFVRDLEVPQGVEVVTDADAIVVNVTETRLEAALEEAELEVGAGATAAAAAAEAEEPTEGESTEVEAEAETASDES